MIAHRPAAPLIAVIALFALLVTFALLYVTIQAGVGAMVGLVFVFLAVGGISLVFFRGFTATGLSIVDKRLEAQREQNRHIEVMAKYTPRERQIEPPKQEPSFAWNPDVEKYRNLAIDLIALSVDTLGSDSRKIVSRGDAQKNDAFKGAQNFENALLFLTRNGLARVQMTGGRSDGTWVTKHHDQDRTVGDLLNLIAPLEIQKG